MASEELDEALQLHADGDLEAAAEAFGQIIDAEGADEAEAWLWLAVTWEDRKDPATAVNYYREALALDLGEQRAFGRLCLARALIAAGEPREALSVIEDTEIEDDDELDDLARSLRRRAGRASWVLRLGPSRYLTRPELAFALLGLLCLASTFLPWVTVLYRGYPFEEREATQFAWQFTLPIAILVSCCAAVLVVLVVRMTDRRRHTLWPVIANTALSVCGLVGGVLGFFVLRSASSDPGPYFGEQFLNVYEARLLPWFYVTCALVVVHAAVSVTDLVRTLRRRSTPAHLR